MKADDLKEFTLLNDTSFFLNGNEYYIFLLNDGYNVGNYNDEESQSFETFEYMLENWKIEGTLLKDLLDKIELND